MDALSGAGVGRDECCHAHLYVGLLYHAELLLDFLQLFLLPLNIGLQYTSPLLKLVLNGLEHIKLG